MGKGIQMSKKVFVIWLCIGFLCCGCSEMGETGKRQLEESGNSQPQLIIGSDIYRPFFFQDDNGRYVGIDVELAREACRRLGYSPYLSGSTGIIRKSYLRAGWLTVSGAVLP